MARLRVRFRFNPGGSGAPMDRLGDFANQTEKFLRALTRDLGVPAKKGEWLASHFKNESVSFDGEYAGSVSVEVATLGIQAMELIARGQSLDACDRGLIKPTTAAEFSQIGKALAPGEHFYMGVYAEESEPELHQVTYQQTDELRHLLATPIVAYGSVQGLMHGWTTGAKEPFFQLRDLATGDLIHCSYDSRLHNKIYKSFERDKTIVHVYGTIQWDRAKSTIVDVKATNLELTEQLSEMEFQSLFGSMPEFTGDMTTSEYIDWIRESDE